MEYGLLSLMILYDILSGEFNSSCLEFLSVLFKLVICRDEAARMWTKREAEWERERLARERLMAEVMKAFCIYCHCFHILLTYGGIFADVIIYIFAHLHTALHTEGNMFNIN